MVSRIWEEDRLVTVETAAEESVWNGEEESDNCMRRSIIYTPRHICLGMPDQIWRDL
jgi:hypothetical protein